MAKPSLPESLSRRFEATVRKYGLIRPGDRVLVAFSGGQDSRALLDLLLGLREEWRLDIALAHLNHRLRGSAASDARFARETARGLGLEVYLGEADVRAYAEREGLNVEEAARVLRYDFLRRTAARMRADKIATGHTLTDQAETFLMRLLRGSGATGLSGIAPMVEGHVIRPLIEIEREEVAAYIRAKRLPFREDETNRDRRLLRNRIRLELLPMLKRKYSPSTTARLGQAAAILRDEDLLLEDEAARAARRVIRRKASGPALDLGALARLAPALRRRVIRLFLREVKGDLRGVSFDDVESVGGLGPGKEFVLGPKLILRREGGLIRRAPAEARPPRFDFLWDGRGRLELPGGAGSLRGRFIRRETFARARFDDEARAYLDAARLAFPLRIRNRRDGDRYRPLGAPGAKKLKEILRAKGLTIAERDRKPVILSGDRIVWVPGLRPAEEFKVRPESGRILVIEIVRPIQ